MIGEDQPELADQCSSETRRRRNLQRISEAGVEEDGRALASRVLEIGTDAVPGVRRVRQALLLRTQVQPTCVQWRRRGQPQATFPNARI